MYEYNTEHDTIKLYIFPAPLALQHDNTSDAAGARLRVATHVCPCTCFRARKHGPARCRDVISRISTRLYQPGSNAGGTFLVGKTWEVGNAWERPGCNYSINNDDICCPVALATFSAAAFPSAKRFGGNPSLFAGISMIFSGIHGNPSEMEFGTKKRSLLQGACR